MERYVQFIPTQMASKLTGTKAGNAAVLDGFLFSYRDTYISKVNKTTRHYFFCEDSSCKMRLTVDNAGKILAETNAAHEHDPPERKVSFY